MTVRRKQDAGFTQSLKFALGGRSSERFVSTDVRAVENGSLPISPRQGGMPLGAKANSSTGFTLIELLAVTAVLIIVTAVVLASNSRFGGRVLLENLAYDIALSIRESQVYGISVSRFGTGFSASYGMHFDSTSANRTTFQLFADAVSANGVYDGCTIPGNPSNCELVSSTAIANGYYIAELCVPEGASVNDCIQQITSHVSRLDILFKRPEPDACISVNGATTVDGSGTCISQNQSARVIVESPRGDTMSIVIENTGQISVQSI